MNFNTILDIVSAAIVFVIMLSERRQKKANTPDVRLLHFLMACVLLVFITDIPGLLLDGAAFSGARPLLWVVDTAYWLSHASYGWLWLMFIDFRLWKSKEHLNKRKILYALPMIAEITLVLLNPLTGWIFTIDSANRYVTGTAYLPNLIPYFVYIASAMILTLCGYLRKRDAEQKRRCLMLLVFMFLPICGIVLEIFAYGVTWVWPLTALSLLMVYVNTQQQTISDEKIREAEEKEKAAQLEKELIDSNIKVMLSQIQPHFLYNSLAVIHELCLFDPETAGVAMKNFSDFLRGNMDSLTMDKPISFEMELNHTKNYLALEKLRFEDAVHIEYDIETTMFRLPTLTLQPIVENAVRYGITKREEGGTVKISTRETDTAFTVTVEDNGVGFDIAEKKKDGRTHIGIANVRDRLRNICGGTLDIVSVPGTGTKAVITLPKGGDAQ